MRERGDGLVKRSVFLFLSSTCGSFADFIVSLQALGGGKWKVNPLVPPVVISGSMISSFSAASLSHGLPAALLFLPLASLVYPFVVPSLRWSLR